MRVVRGIETGIAAEALAWLTPRLLVAALQRGGTVLIDPATGRITTRWPDFSDPDVSAQTRDSLVMLAGPGHETTAGTAAAARLAVVDASAGLRSVSLERIRLHVTFANGAEYSDRAGLAVDPERERAFVFAAGSPVAEVDLLTLRVVYHPDTGQDLGSHDDVLANLRDALWLGGGRVLVFGRDLRQSGDFAAGASLVDTKDWSACRVNPEAGDAAFAPGTLLLYAGGAGQGIGLRAYTTTGNPIFHLFNGDRVSHVSVADHRAYVQAARTIQVIDTRTGEILSNIVSGPQTVDVIAVSSQPDLSAPFFGSSRLTGVGAALLE